MASLETIKSCNTTWLWTQQEFIRGTSQLQVASQVQVRFQTFFLFFFLVFFPITLMMWEQ